MKLKIISNGTPVTTRILNEETGELLKNCSHVSFEVDAKDKTVKCIITLINIPFEYSGEVKIKK